MCDFAMPAWTCAERTGASGGGAAGDLSKAVRLGNRRMKNGPLAQAAWAVLHLGDTGSRGEMRQRAGGTLGRRLSDQEYRLRRALARSGDENCIEIVSAISFVALCESGKYIDFNM